MTPPIVVVDDSTTMLRLLSHALREEGFDVVTGTDGDAALALVREWQPALLILDAEMPVRDGYEVARELASLDTRPYVLMLTAGGREADRQRAEDSGVDEFMTKPFSPSRLRARVREVLEAT